MSNQMFELEIDVFSKMWEKVDVLVEAETLEEAIELFHANPYDYAWDSWDIMVSEVVDWYIDREQTESRHANRNKHERTVE